MIKHYECEHCGFVGSYSQRAGRQERYEELLRIVQYLQTEIGNSQLRETRVKNDYDALKQELASSFAETAGKTATT